MSADQPTVVPPDVRQWRLVGEAPCDPWLNVEAVIPARSDDELVMPVATPVGGITVMPAHYPYRGRVVAEPKTWREYGEYRAAHEARRPE